MMRRAFSLVIVALLVQAPVSWAAQLDKESCAKLKSEQAQLEKDGARGSLGKGPDWAKANLGPEKLEQVRRLIEVDEQLLFRCGGRPLVVLPSDPDAAPGEGAPEKPEKSSASEREKRSLEAAKKAAPAKRPSPPPEKETAREARPAAPLPGGNAPAAGAAREVAKEALPVGAAPAPEAASQPAPPAQDPANVAPAPTAATPPPPSPASKAQDEKKAAALKAAKAKTKKKAEDAYRPPAPEWSSNPFADQVPPAKK